MWCPYSIAVLLIAFLTPVDGAVGAGDTARHLLRSGKVAEAAEIYSKTAKTDPAAAVGLARCKTARGKLDEACAALTGCTKPDAAVHAELARLAFRRGEHKKAAEQVAEALKLDENQLLARWIQAELHRVAGRMDAAGEAYLWLVQYYNDNEVKDAESLRWIGLAAAQHARWNRIPDQFDFLVNTLLPDALKLEPDYWPAHYEAGLLYLEKYNQAEARRELGKALALNPQAAEVHAAMAALRMVGRDIKEAKESLKRAKELDPTLLDAWHVEADLLWDNFKIREATELLEKKVRPLNPVDEQTLGRLAACYVLLDGPPKPGDASRASRLFDEVNARNVHAGEFYLALGDWLEGRHKATLAERYLKEARRRMPELVGPRTSLALLYMHQGREKEARRLLEKAFDVDPFNVRTSNMLRLFEVLDRMKTVETEHLILKFDARQDALLGQYAAEYLDEVYPKLCARFGYTPPTKPLIEVFYRAEGAPGPVWFSARMTGLPYIGTVAASSGRIVAMASPNDPAVHNKFDWARVLRHELTHVITLQQTDFDIPHWYTEALAVDSEGAPRPQRWNELLLERVPKDDLFDLDTINFGFTRPGSSDDWQMAYCQAKLYLDYMRESYPDKPEQRLLTAYAQGHATPEALGRAFGVSQEKFEKGYREYLKKLVGQLSTLSRPRSGLSLKDLQKEHKEKPKDLNVTAELAYAQLTEGDDEEARKLAKQVLEADPKNPLAAYVQARFAVKEKKPKEAIALLEAALDEKKPQAQVLNLLAGLKFKEKQYAEAARLYGLGRKHEPNNPKWLRSLARVHLKAGDEDALYAVLTQLAEAGDEDVKVLKKLVRLASARGDHEVAGRWAKAGVRLDVLDADLHEAFAKASAERHNDATAIREYEAVVALRPKAAEPRLALARAYLAAKRPADARRTLDALLRRSPGHAEAKALLKELERQDWH
ncbi:MAG: tetratricopeptide repeat protein [Pirellulales bacterium]|nr:tetratricopeptide repeat protein [Pirellulales bacterium]